MKKSALILSLLFLAALTAQAAGPLSVKGRVIDRQGRPVPAALAVLISPEDSSVLNFTYVDTSGCFAFEMRTSPAERLIVEVSCMGYEKVRLTVTPPKSNLVVTLEQSSETPWSSPPRLWRR